jgi:hypothetical protein
MTSDVIFKSDQQQSISEEYVAAIVRQNEGRAARGEDLLPVPEAGKSCPRDADHGRMLMSAKTHMLECGVCQFSVAA